MSRHEDSNPGHPLYKNGALPTELCRLTSFRLAYLLLKSKYYFNISFVPVDHNIPISYGILKI